MRNIYWKDDNNKSLYSAKRTISTRIDIRNYYAWEISSTIYFKTVNHFYDDLVIGNRYPNIYFNNEEDSILFRLKYNL